MKALSIAVAGKSAERRGSPRQSRASVRTPARGSCGQPAYVAHYIEAMTAELASMARAANLELLAYFLSMAHAESEAIVEALQAGKLNLGAG